MLVEAGGYFSLAASRFTHREAVRCSGKTRSFGELWDSANRIGSAFAGMKVAEGARVGLLSYNRIELVELWLGLERFNFVRVVLHSHFEMATHVDTLNEVTADVLVFDSRFTTEVEKHRKSFRSVRHFICLGDDAPSWAVRYKDLAATGRPADPHIDVDEDAPCFLQLTSGTTGRPKPWTVSHRAWRSIIATNLEHLDTFGSDIPGVGPDDVNLHFHALQWATGFQTLMPYLLRGARTILLDDSTFDPAKIAGTIIQEKVTGTLMPAPMFSAIADILEKRDAKGSSMRRMVFFFATPEILERATQLFGSAWCHGFGSTEQGAPTTRLTSEDARASKKRLESVGRSASPFFEMAIMDDAGRRLPPGQVGEIVVRSPMSAGGYWNLSSKTEAAFFAGGWFRPSDIGYIDEDGFLYYLDRAKDRIVTSEGVVYPHVVEALLLRHSEVANCGVVGLGEPGKQTVVAAVTLKNPATATPATEGAILNLAASGLPANGSPPRVVFMDELPTVLGGAKVQREVLQSRLSVLDQVS